MKYVDSNHVCIKCLSCYVDMYMYTLIFIGKCFNSNRKDLSEVIKELLCVVESIMLTKGNMYLPEKDFFFSTRWSDIDFLSLRMFFFPQVSNINN